MKLTRIVGLVLIAGGVLVAPYGVQLIPQGTDLTLYPGENDLNAALIDQPNGLACLRTDTEPGATAKLDVSTTLPMLSMTVRFSVVGGGSGYSAPTFNYVQSGANKTYTLTGTPTSIPVDPGSPWSVTPNPLTGSTRSERWYSNQTLSGTASTEMFEFFSFQHQYYLTMKMVPEGVGFISPESGWQNGGTMVKIEAWDGDWLFYQWEGNYSGKAFIAYVVMNGPAAETAYFIPPSPPAGGSSGGIVFAVIGIALGAVAGALGLAFALLGGFSDIASAAGPTRRYCRYCRRPVWSNSTHCPWCGRILL